MTQVVLLTGGNLGDVTQALSEAKRLIVERIGKEVAASSIMRSEAWGFSSSESFLNQALVVDSELSALDILDLCLQIETELGRVREGVTEIDSVTGTCAKKYTSRTIDIDILFYGNVVIDTPRLKIPHPLIPQRAFVLNPLAEVLPYFKHPGNHLTPVEMLRQLELIEKINNLR